MRRLLLPLLLVVGLLGATSSNAEPLRILYAEQVDLPIARSERAALSKPWSAQQLALQAYGREYELRLESNDSLAGRLPPTVLEGKALYRGSLTGVAGSWVRLTIIAGEVFGAFWDGTDLYSIAPGRAVEPFLDAPLPEGVRTGTFVYKLSDTQGGVAHDFCGMSSAVASRGAALSQYKALLSELQSLATNSAIPLQIEVALIGDPELVGRFADAQGQMLAVVNIVDGLFTNQLGVSIIPTDVRVLDATSNPLRSTDAPTLLDQLSVYRMTTPAVREPGLAHLLSGKDLNSSIAGIAFLGALCEPEAGVGLTEGWHSASLSALIMAHELGHNFGAPHDAEAGSPCQSTPPNFLMAPAVNFSDTFSTCSRQQMQSHIANAACVVPLRIADVLPDVPTVAEQFIGEQFDVPIEVRSIGQLNAQDVQLLVRSFSVLTLNGATTTAGTCSVASHTLTCQLGPIPAGETRLVTVQATPGFGLNEATVEASASNDRNSTNNVANVPINASSPADFRLDSSPPTPTGRVGEPISLSFVVDSSGPRAARNAIAKVVIDNTQIMAATPSAGSCVITGVVVDCSFGDLAPGASRRIDLTVQAASVTGQVASLEVRADNDFTWDNNRNFVPINVLAVRDLGLQMVTTGGEFVTDTPFDIVMALRSTGLEPSAPGTVRLIARSALPTFDSVVAPGGTCTTGADTIVCAYDSLAAGEERTITVRAHGPSGVYQFDTRVETTADDVPGNNTGFFQALVRPAIALSVDQVSGGSNLPFVDVPSHAYAFVRSRGVNTATDVTVRAEMPPQFTVTGATLEGGSCNVAGQVVTCNRATLPRDVDAKLDVAFTATQAGSFQANVKGSAPGGADYTLTWLFEVREGIDSGIDPPAPATILLNLPQTLSMVVRNGRLQAFDSRITFMVPEHVLLEAGTVAGGTCFPSTSSMNCFLGTLAPHEVRRIDVRLRARFMVNFALGASATVTHDVNSLNDTASLAVSVTDRQGDAGVQLSGTTASGQVGQPFNLPTITVAATAAVDDARIFMTLDPTLTRFGSVSADGGACSQSGSSGQTLTCLLGTIEPGAARTINVELVGMRAAQSVIIVAFGARNDINLANDTAQISFNLTAPAAPPPPPPAQGSGGGGGGGGGMDLCSLMALITLLTLALSRRRCR